MVIAEHLLPGMAERAMAEVMEQGRGIKNPSMLRQVRITAE
jgi:hypothetical protein